MYFFIYVSRFYLAKILRNVFLESTLSFNRLHSDEYITSDIQPSGGQ